MPRKRNLAPPSYCLHKPSGRAVVRVNGKDVYLGQHGTTESHAQYERVIAEWRASLSQRIIQRDSTAQQAVPTLTISQVLYRYRDFAKRYYTKDGEPTKELAEMRHALRPVRKLYGSTLARDFGPLALRSVRQHMIDGDLSRGVVNNRINRIKRFFKWAVAEELVPPSLCHGLQAVTGLRYGRTEARETEPVKPVPDVWVEAILPFVSPQISAMIQLQRLTGMRPCEVVIMRACDIDMTGEIWIYEPFDHKNRWRGHRRLVPLGPKAQKVVAPFLTLELNAFLFNPRDAEQWRNDQRRKNRKTPMTPSQLKRKPSPKPKRAKRERYDTDSYRRGITYAINKANKKRNEGDQIPHWFPLQLRHSRATEIRKAFGIEAAQVSLGHAQANVTEVYAERNFDLAVEIAQKTG